jgi:ribosomal protein S18 acetylase RimI-like enzyme
VQFRQATAADVPAIVDLVESAYRGEGSRIGWTTEADLLDGQRTDAAAVQALIDDPATHVLLAEDGAGGALVGSVTVTEDGADAVHVGMFAVRPTAQGRGIGRALLEQAETLGRNLGRQLARMDVLAQRPELIAWYERRGYRRTGARAPFPYGDPRSGLPRRNDLVFEVLQKPLAA